MTEPAQIVVLGATGTIGRNTLDVLARHPQRFRPLALSAHSDATALAELCLLHRPRYAVIDKNAAALRQQLGAAGKDITVLEGEAGLLEVVTLPQTEQVLAGIVGAAGLRSALTALRAGKRVLLANKEPLIMAGALFMRALREHGGALLPIDSEHNAVFQCLPAGYRCGTAPPGVVRVVLTASGGPFRNTALAELSKITPAQAVKHPNWTMGPKISVDSATMMNKGLEVIEAVWLFGLKPQQIQVVVHPQSIVHALVEYADGSLLAQLGAPDMRTPIAQALAWPERIASGVKPLDLLALAQLEFQVLEPGRYPCFDLASAALAAGGMAPVVLSAANEIAVAAFLNGQLEYLGIPRLIEATLNRLPLGEFAQAQPTDLDQVLAADRWARVQAKERLSHV
ncbi:MAG: 1-deoxy-D-xylulose-5-phosphate reductoisomerase [Nevskiales bacterium]